MKIPHEIELGKKQICRYAKEELKRLRKEIEKQNAYIKGMKDLAFYLGGSGR